MQEVKFNYQNITAQVSEDSVKIINKNLFVNTDTFRCEVTLAKNGHVLRTETLDTAVEPLSQQTYRLPFGKQQRPGEYTVTVASFSEKKHFGQRQDMRLLSASMFIRWKDHRKLLRVAWSL